MLPFIVGLATGATAVVAYNNNKKIKESVDTGAKKVQELAESGYEKTKEVAADIKASVGEKIDNLKAKKAENETQQVESKEEKVDDK